MLAMVRCELHHIDSQPSLVTCRCKPFKVAKKIIKVSPVWNVFSPAIIKTIFLVPAVKTKQVLFKKITFAMVVFALCTAPLAMIFTPTAHAQSLIDALVKQRVAPDLLEAITANKIDKKSNWIKEDRGVRLVKALIIANSSDVELTSLRADVLAAGGSIYYRYVSVTGLSVMLPASKIAQIAHRADVVSMSANRLTSKTDSFLQTVTGAGSASRGKGTTLDGRGVGIAVLDSGVMAAHHSFDGGRGSFGSRVAKNVVSPSM